MDILGITRPETNVASVKSKGAHAVVINLKTPDSQFIAATLNGVLVIPQHIWSKVKDPATFTNPTPVGSGPFTRITRFTTQDYVLSKNRRYWQASKPLINCLEYVQASSNDAALALIQSGQVDWTHNFVPNVDKAYMVEGQGALPRLLRDDGLPGLARVRQQPVPLQPRRVPSRAVDGDRPQHRVEAR